MDRNWVSNAWYVAGWAHDLEPGRLLACVIIVQPPAGPARLWCMDITDHPPALSRKGDGQVVALEDRCCHRFAPLSMGRVERDDLRCMYHGLKFGPDGRCIEIPGQKLMPQSAFVRRYPFVLAELPGQSLGVCIDEACPVLDDEEGASLTVRLSADDRRRFETGRPENRPV